MPPVFFPVSSTVALHANLTCSPLVYPICTPYLLLYIPSVALHAKTITRDPIRMGKSVREYLIGEGKKIQFPVPGACVG